VISAINTAPELAGARVGGDWPEQPISQKSVAVRVLIAYLNKLLGLPVPKSNEDLPEFYQSSSGLCPVRNGEEKDVYHVPHLLTAPPLQSASSQENPASTPGDSSRKMRSTPQRRWWPKMSYKAEVVRRVELLDQISTTLKDLRRSEMEELERIETEEDA